MKKWIGSGLSITAGQGGEKHYLAPSIQQAKGNAPRTFLLQRDKSDFVTRMRIDSSVCLFNGTVLANHLRGHE
jgi:hypothetical protein